MNSNTILLLYLATSVITIIMYLKVIVPEEYDNNNPYCVKDLIKDILFGFIPLWNVIVIMFIIYFYIGESIKNNKFNRIKHIYTVITKYLNIQLYPPKHKNKL